MGLKKLIDAYKRYFKNYKSVIKPCVKFSVDTHHYLCAFIPTIVWIPAPYRHPGSSVIDIAWLHFNIAIGEWRYVEK